jgi:epoxyqueuosine reductase QueG
MELENYQQLGKLATGLGFHLFGVADVRAARSEFIFPPELVAGLDYGIALGFRLQEHVLEEIQDHPTYLYFNHYRQVNNFLDQSALKIAAFIQERGYKVLPIATSQVVDWEKQRGHLSHKKIAALAGLGWIGRNNLLVNPRFGAQLRLVTLLTDWPLKTDKPLAGDCGTCAACLSVCPAGSIRKSVEEFDHLACFTKLKEFQKQGYVPQSVCGICVKACRGVKNDRY